MTNVSSFSNEGEKLDTCKVLNIDNYYTKTRSDPTYREFRSHLNYRNQGIDGEDEEGYVEIENQKEKEREEVWSQERKFTLEKKLRHENKNDKGHGSWEKGRHKECYD